MKVRRKDADIPQANKLFTDREEPRNSFWDCYEEYRDTLRRSGEIRVLTYYGIGGIGKSALLKKLISELEEKIKKPKYVFFDLQIKQESRGVLESIKNILSERYHFTFPLFDLAVYNYSQKVGENMSAPEIKAFAEKSPLLSLALDAAGAFPAFGLVPLLLSLADKGVAITRKLIGNLIDSHKRDIYDIETKSPAELYAHLPYLFAQDLSDNLKDSDEPLVVFLDTYERLVNEMASVGDPLLNDEWLRGMNGPIQNCSNVLWVIAGREKLKWERFDGGWSDAVDQHLLGVLSPIDSSGFLESAGVADEALRDQLYELTGGTPVYLDLCVDQYLALTADGAKPVIDDFGSDIHTLIECFVRYMDDRRKELTYLLSCLGLWNDELLLSIGRQVLPAFSVSSYASVKGLSFITESDTGFYTIHQTISSVLLSQCPEYIRSAAYRSAADFCKQKTDEFSPAADDFTFWLDRYVEYAYRQLDKADYIGFFEREINGKLDKLCDRGRFDAAISILDTISAFLDGSDRRQTARLLRAHVWVLHSAGRYGEELETAERCFSLYREFSDENDLGYLAALSTLATAYEDNGKYEEALEAEKQVFEKLKDILGEDHPDTLSALNNLAVSLSDLGKHQEALEAEKQVFEKRKDILGEDHPDTLRTLGNLANSLSDLGKHQEALEAEKQVFEKLKDILDEDHPDTLTALNNLANSLSDLGRHVEALEVKIQVYEKRKDILGEDHPDTLTALNNLANSLSDLGRHAEALELQTQVYEKRKDILGEDHPDTLNALGNLANSLSRLGRHAEALEVKIQVYEKRKDILGEDHPGTLRALNNLANSLSDLGRHVEALEVKIQVYEKCEKLLGEDHPDTLMSLGNLANSLSHLGRHAEALEAEKQVYEKRKDILGEDHPDTLISLGNLAVFLSRLGRHAEALELQTQVYEKRKDILGEDHPDTLRALHNLAISLALLGQLPEALEACEQAYEKRKEILGEDHPDTKSSRELLELLRSLQ